MKKLLIIISLFFCFSANNLFAEQTTSSAELSQPQLEQILAPIALYPDSLLTHILIAATYPLEVIEAERWLSQNSTLGPEQTLQQAEAMGWDPSIMALLPFPSILKQLSNDLNWTRQLGDAFLQSEAQVLSSIQTLRMKADEAGNLDKMTNMDISREDDYIIIQPVQKEIIYVPYYDTRVIYGPWHWDHYPPVYWPYYSHHYATHHGPFYWHSGVHISLGLFFSNFHWRNHHVVISRHHNSHYYSRHNSRHNKAHRSHYNSLKKRNFDNHYSGQRHPMKRWQHQPSHRKGVAYSNERLRKRYQSNRPGVDHNHLIRSQKPKMAALQNHRIKKNRLKSEAVRPTVTHKNTTNVSRYQRFNQNKKWAKPIKTRRDKYQRGHAKKQVNHQSHHRDPLKYRGQTNKQVSKQINNQGSRQKHLAIGNKVPRHANKQINKQGYRQKHLTIGNKVPRHASKQIAKQGYRQKHLTIGNKVPRHANKQIDNKRHKQHQFKAPKQLNNKTNTRANRASYNQNRIKVYKRSQKRNARGVSNQRRSSKRDGTGHHRIVE